MTLTNADIGKRVAVTDSSGAWSGRLTDVFNTCVGVMPEGGAVPFVVPMAHVMAVEEGVMAKLGPAEMAGTKAIANPPLTADAYAKQENWAANRFVFEGTFSNELTPHDNMRKIVDRVTEQFEEAQADYYQFQVGMAERLKAAAAELKRPILSVDTGPPQEKVDHTARRYMTFHRMVSEVMAQEAPKAKFVTDKGMSSDPYADDRGVAFVAWITLVDGYTATYEASGHDSYDGDNAREQFKRWLRRGLRLSGKRSNS